MGFVGVVAIDTKLLVCRLLGKGSTHVRNPLLPNQLSDVRHDIIAVHLNLHLSPIPCSQASETIGRRKPWMDLAFRHLDDPGGNAATNGVRQQAS